MFVYSAEPRISWPVKVSVPVNNGRVEEQRFTAVFGLVPRQRRQDLASLGDDGLRTILAEAWLGHEGIVQPDGTAVPWSPELRDKLLQLDFFMAGMTAAYGELLSGKAAEGNSEKSGVPGP